MSAVLFLDVDGVLNAFPPPPSADYVETNVNGWTIAYRPDIVDRVNALSERIELRWLTTWQDDARDHLAPALGIVDFPTVSYDRKRPNPDRPWPLNWWKSAAADEFLRGDDRPFVWCDDDLMETVKSDVRARYGGGRCHLVSPSLGIGLTHDQMDAIEAFIEANP